MRPDAIDSPKSVPRRAHESHARTHTVVDSLCIESSVADGTSATALLVCLAFKRLPDAFFLSKVFSLSDCVSVHLRVKLYTHTSDFYFELISLFPTRKNYYFCFETRNYHTSGFWNLFYCSRCSLSLSLFFRERFNHTFVFVIEIRWILEGLEIRFISKWLSRCDTSRDDDGAV